MTAYKAAAHNRLTSGLPSYSRSSREEMTTGVLQTIRARSRYIYKNNPHAKGIIDLIARRVVGGTLRIQSRIKFFSGQYNQNENAIVEELLNDWSQSGVSTTGLSLLATLKLLITTRLVDGEVFLVKQLNPAKQPIAREWRILRGDQLAETKSGRNIYQGIEYKGDRPIAYHFYEAGDTSSLSNSNRPTVRITADKVIHWYKPDYPDQTRGMPVLTSVILSLSDLDDYKVASLIQAHAQANVVAFVETPHPMERMESAIDPTYTDDTETPERWSEDMVPGVKEYLLPGERVTFADPTAPSGNFDPFTIAILRSVAAGVGISYENLNKDFSRSNYSSSRQASLEDKLTYKDFSVEMDEAVISPLYRDFIDLVYNIHQLRPLPVDAQSIYTHTIIHPQIGHVDPLKEATALIDMVDNKLMSRREAIAERGRDFYEVIDELSEEEAYMQKKGLSVSTAEVIKRAQPIREVRDTGDEVD
jgi:lambda family phage portal protein